MSRISSSAPQFSLLILLRFQELELKHVPDRGCSSAVEFR